MAGRKPKPTAVKKLEGNPGKRKLNTKEPVPAKTGKSVKDQAGIGLNGNGAEGDDPCNGCFGAAENACQKCEKKKVNTNVTGCSADDLRERLNFIKKYI